MRTIFKADSDQLADGKWMPYGIVRELQDRQTIKEWSPSPTEKTYDTEEEANKVFTDYCLQQGWQPE
ncbi:MAG: hypothetical protein ABH856_01825 [Patescibacteria group bacterium]